MFFVLWVIGPLFETPRQKDGFGQRGTAQCLCVSVVAAGCCTHLPIRGQSRCGVSSGEEITDLIPNRPLRPSGLDPTIFSAPNAGMDSIDSRSMLGRTLGHYELVTSIGKGAMGEVYKGRDSRLDRVVALKVLPPDLAEKPDVRQRFEREARTIAKLNHPHICTLYDVGRQGDVNYLVMEYLEGETLADLLAKGPLSLDRTLRYAIDIADALDQAHRKGVTHRDIKPRNIIVTRDDWLKVLDFGVAKLAEDSQPVRERTIESQDAQPVDQLLTQPGAIMGTIAYMSPEQAAGERVDARSDIFSFGVVVYEMLSDHRPFQKTTAAQTLKAILHEDPTPLRSIVDGIPQEVEKIVGRCLCKDPALRFQSMADVKGLLADLRRRTTRAHSREIPSVAVLPFANLSTDPENEYFSDGLTDELIGALSQVPHLRVVSRASAFQFKGRNHDLSEVGRKLEVNTVLDGSVRRAGNRIRIAAELVNVSDGLPIWSESFERELADVFEVQDEVTRTILATLKPKLVTRPQTYVKNVSGENIAAHELYLKGKYFWNLQTPHAVAKARDYFQQAVSLRPEHAMAHAGLADSWLLLGWYGLSPASEAMSNAKSAAQAALAIDDDLALAHCSLALVHAGYDWNWPMAAERFARALELGPGFSAIHFHYALDYLTPIGRLDEAAKEIMLAQELDPLSLITRTALGGCFYRKGQYDAAIAQCQNTLEIDPNFYHAHWTLARAYEQKYLYEEAVEEFQKAYDLSGENNPQIRGELGHCYGRMAQADKAQAILSELKELSNRAYVSPLSAAFVYLGLRKKDEALEHLSAALAERSRPLVWIKVDPRFEPLQSDVRFKRLLERIGLAR
jgi:eukaryotic-like serine/threonine-protein kinase